MPIEEAIMDNDRVHYFQGTTAALLNAIHEDGVQIRSYFPWSALNSFPFAPPGPDGSPQVSSTTSSGLTVT